MKDTRGLAAWVQMIRTFSTMQSLVDHSLSAWELTLAQFNLLVTLNFHEGLNQNELAGRLGVTKGNVVGLLNRLSARGLVERMPVAGDLRVNRPRLTAAGRKLIEESLPGERDLVVQMTQSLSIPELDTLTDLLKRLEEANALATARVSEPPIAIRNVNRKAL